MTSIQKRIYKKLLNGSTIHASSEQFGATISGFGADLDISSAEFYRLVNMGMIYQEGSSPFYYRFNQSFKQ